MVGGCYWDPYILPKAIIECSKAKDQIPSGSFPESKAKKNPAGV